MESAGYGRSNEAESPAGSGFARWSATELPPVDRLLLGLAAQFHSVDEEAALDRLDELARPAFGIAALPLEEAAARLITVLRHEGGFTIAPPADSDGLMLDRVIAGGRGRPELLAALYFEVARRAGVAPTLLSSGPRWLVGLEDDHELVLVSPAPFAPPGDRIELRRRCAHQLADGVLARLGELFRATARAGEAARVLALRRSLPVARIPNGRAADG